MARLFSFNQALSRNTSLVSGPPFSVSAWVKITATMPTGGMAFSARAASQNDEYSIGCLGLSPRLLTLSGGTGATITGSAQALNTWIHLCGVWSSTTSRALYVNSVLAGSDATPVSPPAPTSNLIGALASSGADFHSFFGEVAYLGVYNFALTQGNVTSLFATYDPSIALSSGLIAFPRLAAGLSPEPDTISTTPWIVTGSSIVATDPDAGTLVSPNLNDPRQAGLPETGFQTYSYYLQPWKSYMDTWRGQRFLDGLGVNFRSGAGNESGTAQVLAAAGFTHGRIEFGWSGLNYTDDSIGTPGWTPVINALKSVGIRPLILLNNNLGGICPYTALSLTATATSAIGATTITVANTAGIIVGKTGLRNQKGGYQVYPFITAFNSGTGVCTLSAPLLAQVTSGSSVLCFTLKYHPLCTGGLANSFSAETMTGWRTYVTTICTFVSGILGNNNFDVEVINEDTSALDDNNFYSPANSTIGALTYTSTVYPSYTLNGNTAGDNRAVLVPITVDVVQASFPGVRIINGMSNLRPQDNAFNTPPGVTAFSRHNYTKLDGVSPINGVYGVSNPSNPIQATNPPTNALFGYDGTPANSSTAPTPPNPSTVTAGTFFIPTFTLSCPEGVVGMGLKHEWMLTDLLPFPGLLTDGNPPPYRGLHWRGGLNPITGNTVGLWETETNTDRKVWVNGIMTPTNRDTDPASINLWMYAGAKSLLRMFVFNIHKGMQTVCAFADRNINEPYVLSIIPEAFFTALAANSGVLSPAIQALAGSQIAAMTNMTTLFDQYVNASPFTVNALTVDSVSSYSNIIDFSGDGTTAHPDWRHVDGLGVFPFHVNQSTYIVGYYVVTPDVVHNWNVAGNTGALDISNYTMPDEAYKLSLSGMGSTASVSSYDPITGAVLPASILSQDSNSIAVNVLATDYPRFLVISTSVPTTYTDSPSLSSSGNWVMQGVVFKVPGAAASTALNTPVSAVLGSLLSFKTRDTHRSIGSVISGSVLSLNDLKFLTSSVGIGSLTIQTFNSRDSHRGINAAVSGNLLSVDILDTHRAKSTVSSGTAVSVTSRDTHQARSFTPGATWESIVSWESSHFWNEAGGVNSWLSQVVLSANASQVSMTSVPVLTGSVLSPIILEAHRAKGVTSLGTLSSEKASDLHQSAGTLTPGALLTPRSRDMHASGAVLFPQTLLSTDSSVTHISTQAYTLGVVLIASIKYKHQSISAISQNSVVSLTSRDTHRAVSGIAPQVVLGLNPVLTQIAVTTLSTPASSVLGSIVSLTSRDAHRVTGAVASGSVALATPILSLFGAVTFSPSAFLSGSAQMTHLAKESLLPGALLSLTSRDTHRPSTIVAPGTVLGLAPVLTVIGPTTFSTPVTSTLGSILSVTNRDLHGGGYASVSGTVLGEFDVLVFIDAVVFGVGSTLVSSKSRVTHQAKSAESLGTVLALIGRDTHGAIVGVAPQTTLSANPTLTIGALTTLSTPVSSVAGSLLSLKSRDTHQATTFFSSGATINWESSVDWESADAWEAGFSVQSLVSQTFLNLNSVLTLIDSVSVVSGNLLSMKSRDTHRESGAILSGSLTSTGSRDNHGAIGFVAPGTSLGLNPTMTTVSAIFLSTPASVTAGTSVAIVSRDAHGAVDPVSSGAVLGLNAAVTLLGSIPLLPGTLVSLVSRDTHRAISSVVSSSLLGLISSALHGSISAMAPGSFLTLADAKTTGGFTQEASAVISSPGSVLSAVLRYRHQAGSTLTSGTLAFFVPALGLSSPANITSGSLTSVVSRDTHGAKTVEQSGSVLSPILRFIHGGAVSYQAGSTVSAKVSGAHRSVTSIGSGSIVSLNSRDTHQVRFLGIQGANWQAPVNWESGLAWESGTVNSMIVQTVLGVSATVTHGSMAVNITVQGLAAASPSVFLLAGTHVGCGTSNPIKTSDRHGAISALSPILVVNTSNSMFKSSPASFSLGVDWEMEGLLTTVGNVNDVDERGFYPRHPRRRERRY